MLVNAKNSMSVGTRGLHFKIAYLINLLNFEWFSQNEVSNVLVLFYCGELVKNSIMPRILISHKLDETREILGVNCCKKSTYFPFERLMLSLQKNS